MRELVLCLMTAVVCWAQSPASSSVAGEEAKSKILLLSANRGVDPQYLNHTLPWPKEGTEEWGTLTMKLIAGLVTNRLDDDLKAAGVDSISITIKDGPKSLEEIIPGAIVKLQRNRILQVTAFVSNEASKKGIWIEASLMRVVPGDKTPTGTKLTLKEVWKDQFAHTPKATLGSSNESPLTLEAWRNADEVFKKLKDGGYLDASTAPAPQSSER